MPKSTTNNTLQNLGFALALIVCPLVFSLSLSDPWNMPRFVALAGYLTVFGGLAVFQKRFELKLNHYFVILAVGFIQSTFYASNQSPDGSEAAYIGGMRFLMIGLVFWLAAQPKLDKVPAFLSVFGLIQIFLVVLELLGITDFDVQAEGIVGAVGNPNGFGSLMVLLLPIAVLNWNDATKNIRLFARASAVLMVLGIAFSTSIAAYIAFGLLLLMLGLWKLLGAKLQARPNLWRFALTGLLLLLIVAPVVYGMAKYQPEVKSETPLNSITERSMLWGETWEMVQESPMQGNGLAGWKYAILERGVLPPSTDFGARYYAEPHNDFLGALAETGLFGLFAYLGLCLYMFHIALRQALKASSEVVAWRGILLAGGMVAWCVFSSFHFPIERMDHLIVFGALIALILRNEKPVKLHLVLSKVILGHVVLISLYFLVFGWNRMQSEVHLKKAMQAKQDGNWKEVLVQCDLTRSRYLKSDFYSSTPIEWFEGVAHYQLQDIPRALEHFQAAFKINPHHPHVLNNLAAAYVGVNDLENALVYYEKARETFPTFVDPYINIAKIKVAQGDKTGAIKTLKEYPELPKKGKNIVLDALRELE